MKQEFSKFSRVTTLDYRNGKYQGIITKDSSKRNEFGILIDDDMNMYFSEWSNGQLNGLTFIYFQDGTYTYGRYKNNVPHGLNVFRNKQFILLATYLNGEIKGNVLAVTDSINYLLVLDGNGLIEGKQSKKERIVSFENITEIGYFEDIIIHSAKKSNLILQRYESSLIKFLEELAKRYQNQILLAITEGKYYFGFKNGLGFKFLLTGKVNHKIKIKSIGNHENYKITNFGAKYHQNRCIEEGNFQSKETITYNRSFQRPKDKSQLIFQKLHKKSLSFVNEYFQFKNPIFGRINHYLLTSLLEIANNQIVSKFQDHSKPINITQPAQKYDKSVEKQINQHIHRTSSKYLFQSPQTVDKSKRRKNSTIQNEQQRKSQSKYKYSNLLVKQNRCQKCEKRRTSAEKLSKSKSKSKSKSISIAKNDQIKQSIKKIKQKSHTHQNIQQKKQLAQNQNANKFKKQSFTHLNLKPVLKQNYAKQPKYIKNYKQRSIQNINSEDKIKPEHSKSTQNLTRIIKMKELQKYDLQRENQLKIRQQIHLKQMKSDFKASHSVHYNQILPYQPVIKPVFDYNIPPMRGPMVQSDNLQQKRQKLLKQFRLLNGQKSAQQILINDIKRQHLQNSMRTEVQLSHLATGLFEKENKNHLYQFNQRYKNLIKLEQPMLQNRKSINSFQNVELYNYEHRPSEFSWKQKNRLSALSESIYQPQHSISPKNYLNNEKQQQQVDYPYFERSKNPRYQYFFDKK